MPPPDLKPEDEVLIREMVKTFQAGHPEPKSYSDFKRGMMAVLTMFAVERRALPYDPVYRASVGA